MERWLMKRHLRVSNLPAIRYAEAAQLAPDAASYSTLGRLKDDSKTPQKGLLGCPVGSVWKVTPLKTNEFVPWKMMVGSDVFPTEIVPF